MVGWFLRLMAWGMVAIWSLSGSCYSATVVSESQVLQVFFEKNLPMLAGKAQLDKAQAELAIARQVANPSMSLSVAGIGDSKNWQGGNSYWDKPYSNNLSVSQLVETAGKRQLRIAGAELGAQAQGLLFEDLLRLLKREVLIAYYQVVKQQQMVALYNEILQKLNETSRANFLRLKAGDISETEFNRIEVAVLKAKTDVEQAHLALSLARQQLSELLVYHFEPEQLVTVDHFPQTILMPNQTASKNIQRALSLRPDVQAAQRLLEQQQTSVSLAEKLSTPDVQLGMQLVHDPSAATKDSFGVGVGISLPLWHQFQGEIQQARAQKRVSELSLAQLEHQVKTQVLQAHAQFEQKQRILARFDEELIGRAVQIRRSSLIAYQQGAISLLELLDAENNYRTTMLDYTQAQYDLVQAKLSLDYALGEEGNGQ
ncbi:MAG: TolC family protein [Gammaproteobacteria bacterium]|nr:TolC family protein [Gammaproteobacteria bacterium]